VAKQTNINLFVVLALIGLGIFLFINQDIDFGDIQSVLPGLDNRIVYFDVFEDFTQFVFVLQTGTTNTYINNKMRCNVNPGNAGFIPIENDVLFLGGNTQNDINCQPLKDFSRLETFIRYKTEGAGTSRFTVDNVDLSTTNNIFRNVEIIPDNLNKGVYDIFVNGEFSQRIDIEEKKLIISFFVSRATLTVDYIKYVPPETFTIFNDEVWVKEVRGSDYAFDDLDWEMIGFHTLIRPATIRDLIAETEVPAPQIYINLINNIPVEVQPDTVHTFFYRTKWVEGLDSSCQGNLDQVNVKQDDGTWKCEGFVDESPIIQQCAVKEDCPILPECENQRDLIVCTEENLCDYTDFSPECKNQLATFQELVFEKTKFVTIPSGANQFFCFFDKTTSSCTVGEKTISATSPSYVCDLPDEGEVVSIGIQADSCWKSTLTFDGSNYVFFVGDEKSDIGFDIEARLDMSASLDSDRVLKDNWVVLGKFTLPDDFLDIKSKELGDNFILQDSDEKVTFTVTNNLFGIDGGYIIQTQNLALEGGAIIRNEVVDVFLNAGETDITYDFTTHQLGTIVDIIEVFAKVTTDKKYILKSSTSGLQEFLVVTKKVVTELPPEEELEKLNQVIVVSASTPTVDITPTAVEVTPTEPDGVSGILLLILGVVIAFGAFTFLKKQGK